ncbi:STAS-like domain-containing protein [Alishewanella sp. SMS8]|uniref:STAS-like domain-containing protein n=1 Tax=Alishewanella sp. SMS8 TaxID=2994676 RepID=UPI00274210ED|nr:STAS-like domain-containing protein [Alishewanella sp. SMS8]MDP5205842.1 STAS-like domain-containing protein [Alishewanella sp. SMS9]MDP5459860.1 STAS-like domain-containing protein [Alishewanella sp. SMS8]
MKVLKVADFAKFPGPRYRSLGKFSGEEFRDDILVPRIKEQGESLVIDLDGVFGYGSSFLEEAFGGLVRKGLNHQTIIKIVANLKCTEQPELKKEIQSYVESEISARVQSGV